MKNCLRFVVMVFIMMFMLTSKSGILFAKTFSGITLWEDEPFVWNREVPRPRKQVVVSHWRATDPNVARVIKELAQEFMKTFPEIIIKFDDSIGADQLPQKVILAAAAGVEPLIVEAAAPYYIGKYVYNGIAKDMKEYVSENYLKDLLNPQIYKYKGGFYGFPHELGLGDFIYNKDIFDAAGVSVPNNWAELRSVLKKLTRLDSDGKSIKQYGMALSTGISVDPYHWYAQIFWSAKAEDIDETLTRCLMTTRQYQSVLEFLDMLANVDHSLSLNAFGMFIQAKAAIYPGHGGYIGASIRSGGPANCDVMKFPGPNGEKPPAIVGGYIPLITRRFDRVDKDTQNATLLWIAFLSSNHAIQRFQEFFGGVHGAVRRSLAYKLLKEQKFRPYDARSVQWAMEFGAQSRPPHPMTTELQIPITQAWYDILIQRAPIENTLINAAKKVQGILDSIRP